MSSAEDASQAAENDAAALGGLNYASVGQIYETTIHADGVPSMRFVSVPRRVLEPGTTDSDAELNLVEFLRILDLDPGALLFRQFFPTELPLILYQCLVGELFPGIPSVFLDDRANLTGEQRRLVEFAEYLAFEDLIPFELSDQQSRSLGKIILTGATTGAGLGAAGAGAKIGATGGFIIGAPAGPLVFITVPAGFVVGGLVGALTEALGERLYDRLRNRRKPKPS